MKRVGAILGIAALVAACSPSGGPILANPPATRPSFPAATVPPAPIGDPVPIVLPRF